MNFNANDLQPSELDDWYEGLERFNSGRYWHAHESWEEVWKALKRRQAPPHEILLVQGLIQSAAMLLHHQRERAVSVGKQWEKLQPKLAPWHHAWGLSIREHLQWMAAFANDAGVWDLTTDGYQIPLADG